MDERLFLNINRHWVHPALDWTMALASNIDFWAPLLIALAALVAWRGGVRGRVCLVCLALTLGATELTVSPLKRVFSRPRPSDQLAGVRQVGLDRRARPRLLAIGRPLEVRFSPAPRSAAAPPPSLTAGGATAGSAAGTLAPAPGRAFPSGHTMDNFAIATMLSLLFRPWGRWAFLVAATVGYSRIYTGSHWPSDVLLSALLAIGFALCLAALMELAWARWGQRWLPVAWARHPRLFTERLKTGSRRPQAEG